MEPVRAGRARRREEGRERSQRRSRGYRPTNDSGSCALRAARGNVEARLVQPGRALPWPPLPLRAWRGSDRVRRLRRRSCVILDLVTCPSPVNCVGAWSSSIEGRSLAAPGPRVFEAVVDPLAGSLDRPLSNAVFTPHLPWRQALNHTGEDQPSQAGSPNLARHRRLGCRVVALARSLGDEGLLLGRWRTVGRRRGAQRWSEIEFD